MLPKLHKKYSKEQVVLGSIVNDYCELTNVIGEWRMKKLFTLLIAILLLVNCSKNEKNYTVKEIDGVKVFHNTTTPADPNFKITPKKLFTISGDETDSISGKTHFKYPTHIDVDDDGNIYILDNKSASIIKYDSSGKFIKKIGSKGQGPGELDNPWLFSIFKGTIYVSEFPKCNHLFTTDGEFLQTDSIIKSVIEDINDSTLLSENLINEAVEDKMFMTHTIGLMKDDFKDFKTLELNKFEDTGPDCNIMFNVIPYCVGNDKIYIAKRSYDQYEIDEYNSHGVNTLKIRKSYARIPLNDKELESYVRSRNTFDNAEKANFKQVYKQVIHKCGMHIDKNGNLLVEAPVKRTDKNEYDYIVDVFKDGVFINTIKLDIGKGFDYYHTEHRHFFKGNRIFYMNREENSVTVYEY